MKRMNDLEKLAKEKYNGDLKAAWKYVLYEASAEEREMYTKYVSKEQLDIGMTALQKGPRNELDELADSKFDGDLQKTWNYIFSSCTPEEIDKYVAMADSHQAAMAVLLVDGLRVTPEGRKLQKALNNMEVMKMTSEEVLTADKNPYTTKVWISLAKITIAVAAIIAATVLGANLGWEKEISDAVGGVLGIVNSLCAFDLADKLRYFFKFRTTKKTLEKMEKKDRQTV